MSKLHNPFPLIREQNRKVNIPVTCPLCGRDATASLSPHIIPFITVACDNCVKYAVQEDFLESFSDSEHAYLLSGEMRHTQENMATHLINAESAHDIIDKQLQLESENRNMAYLIWHYDQMEGGRNGWREFIEFPAMAYCKDEEALMSLTEKAVELGYLEKNEDKYKPTAAGVNFSSDEREKERSAIIEYFSNRNKRASSGMQSESLSQNSLLDLRKFYLDNVESTEYYYRFYKLIYGANETWNAFRGIQETNSYSFEVIDSIEAIEKFKLLCMPENENHNKEDQCWFYVTLYYLYKHGYYLEQFPKLIERPPEDTYEFVNREIRTRLISEGKDANGTVRYATRRAFVGEFSFKQKGQYIDLNEDIEAKFKRISTRDADFQAMSRDEKLAEIVNLIENLMKKDGNYIELDYSNLYGFINDDIIKNYKKKLQCFRHSAEQSIAERENFTNEQKDFLIDFGLVIVKSVHKLIENNNSQG